MGYQVIKLDDTKVSNLKNTQKNVDNAKYESTLKISEIAGRMFGVWFLTA